MFNPDPRSGPEGKRIPLTAASRPSPTGPADQHVEPHADGWCVRAEGETLPSFVGPTRHEAFVWAAEVARRSNTRLFVHRTDGTVITTLDFGTDS